MNLAGEKSGLLRDVCQCSGSGGGFFRFRGVSAINRRHTQVPMALTVPGDGFVGE